MQTWPWFCYQSGLAPRIWSYYHLKDSLVNTEAFLTCPQPSFYFLSSNPEVDVLGSSNSEQNLESICLCVLNSLCFPVSADFVCVVYIFVCCVYICVCCVYIWVTLFCTSVTAAVILGMSFRIITSLSDVSSPILKFLLRGQGVKNQIKVSKNKIPTLTQQVIPLNSEC